MLVLGIWVFPIIVLVVILILLAIRYRPEWVKDEESGKRIKKDRLEKAVIKSIKKQVRNNIIPDNCIVSEKVLDGSKTVDIYWLAIDKNNSIVSYYENKSLRIDFRLTNNMDAIILLMTNKVNDIMSIRWNKCTLNDYLVEVDEINSSIDDSLPLNKTEKRTIRCVSEQNKSATRALLKSLNWSNNYNLLLKLKVVYNDNKSDVISINFKVMHVTDFYEL